MYRVFCDDALIYDLRDESLILIDPTLDLEVNKAGSFTFKLPPTHPEYDTPRKMLSRIQVLQDDEEIFKGRIINIKNDFYNQKLIECEGELAFLNDSIQRPAEYHNYTVRGFLQALIAAHNEQVEADKRFEVGIVTVRDSNDSLYRYTNYGNTMQEIKEDLIDDLGGYIRVRNYNGHRYIDYIESYGYTSTQTIEFGENLLDFSRNIDLTDIATAIIPLGANQEEGGIAALQERVNIKEVNSGVDYLYIQEAVNELGWIFKTVIFDEVSTPAMLKSKGMRWLKDYQWDSMIIETKAIDLHYTDSDIEAFKLGDEIHVVSPLHGLDRYFPLSKMKIYLNKLSSNKITLGGKVKSTLTARSNAIANTANKALMVTPVPSSIVKEAVDQATALITAATHGYVVTTPNEQLIMDTDNVETATKIWRWNLNGLGYSDSGYNGEYATAITMDGQIVGNRIVGNSISGEKLDITYRQQVEQEIADAEEAARIDSEGYTDNKLKNYYTKSQVDYAIGVSSEGVILTAKEQAQQYVDGKLKNYSTTAQIKVTTDAITSEVSKKLNSSEFSTKIQQNATSVKIAWNNISKYIQFESGELRIYDSANTSSQKIVSKFNYNGSHFYRDGHYLGKIGTNYYDGTDSYRGLVFDLEYQTSYMAWAAKDSSTATSYTIKFAYHHKTSKGKKGLHLACETYAHGNLYLSDNNRFIAYSNNSVAYDGWFSFRNTNGNSLVINQNNGRSVYIPNDVSIDFYSSLDMHGFAINNQSDARMKKNIENTRVNALEILNAFDLKSFDWVQTGEHEEMGIIAQQLQQIAPELVDDTKGYLQIKTTKFIYYLIKAIQELSDSSKYKKVEWVDPYTLLEKKAFCAALDAQIADDYEEVIYDPPKIPIQPERRT